MFISQNKEWFQLIKPFMKCPQRNHDRTWESGYPTSNCHTCRLWVSFSGLWAYGVSLEKATHINTICTRSDPLTLQAQILRRKKSSQTWPCSRILTSPYFEDAKAGSWGCWRLCESWKAPMLWINTHLCNKSISIQRIKSSWGCYVQKCKDRQYTSNS